VQKLVLPSWIEGDDRAILTDYVKGIRPADILQKYQLTHSALADMRRYYGVPSQVELRKRGLINPAPGGRQWLRDEINGKVIFGPKKQRLRDLKTGRDKRVAEAVEEYKNGPPGLGVVVLAKKYHVAPGEISEVLKAQGLEIKRGRKPGQIEPKPPSPRNLAMIEAVVKHNKSFTEVGRAQNPPISRERVRQIVKRAGYNIVRRHRRKSA
jgi:hypothetical protein